MADQRKTIENDMDYLRMKSSDVNFETDNYRNMIQALREYCIHSECYALAPIQIGIPKRIIYIRNTSSDMAKNIIEGYTEDIIYINPTIKSMQGHTSFLEGCASCKYSDGNYLVGIVDRPYEIVIEYLDIHGQKEKKTITGFEATVFCHEYDHLDGILHIDRCKDIIKMTKDQMKDFRLKNEYKIISNNGIFKYDNVENITL